MTFFTFFLSWLYTFLALLSQYSFLLTRTSTMLMYSRPYFINVICNVLIHSVCRFVFRSLHDAWWTYNLYAFPLTRTSTMLQAVNRYITYNDIKIERWSSKLCVCSLTRSLTVLKLVKTKYKIIHSKKWKIAHFPELSIDIRSPLLNGCVVTHDKHWAEIAKGIVFLAF